MIPRRSKYNSRRTVVDGISFHSKGEAERYKELKLMERNLDILNLELQVPFNMKIGKHKICSYKADFVYWDMRSNKKVVEDFKGFRTNEYRIKSKLMKALFGIDILETGGRKR